MADIYGLVEYILNIFSLLLMYVSVLFHRLIAYIPGLWNYILSNYTLVLFSFTVIGSLIYALIGKFFYKVSLFQPLEELAHRQANYRRERKLRKFNKKIALDYLELGDSLLDVSQLDAAKVAYEKAFSLDPINKKAYKGILKSEILQPILKLEPTYYDIYKSEKKINMIIKETTDDLDKPHISIKWLHTLYKQQANKWGLSKSYTYDKHALYYLGELYRNVDNERASGYYKQVLSIKPESALNGLAYYGLSWIAITRDADHTIALPLMEKAEEVSGGNPVILSGIGYEYLFVGNYNLAIEKLNSLLSSNPYVITAHWNIIHAYRITGKYEDAYVYSKKLIHCIEVEDVFSLELNRRLNFVATKNSGAGEFFREIIDKKCYSYCTAALTCYLMDHKIDSNKYMNKALSLSCDHTKSLNALYYNIECIRVKHTELTHKLDNFRLMIKELKYYNKYGVYSSDFSYV